MPFVPRFPGCLCGIGFGGGWAVDKGASPAGPGHSGLRPEPASRLGHSESVPSAPSNVNYVAWSQNMISFIRQRGLEQEFTDWCGGWPCPIESDESDAVSTTSDIALRRVASQVRHRLSDMVQRSNVSWPASSPASKTASYVVCEVADWQLRQWLAIIENVAQAIEARRAETGTGSVHESAVRQDAPNPNPASSSAQSEGPTAPVNEDGRAKGGVA